MTPGQRTTFRWILRSRPASVLSHAPIIVQMEGQGHKHAVIHSDGSYQTAKLGDLHRPPTKTRRMS